MKMLHQFYIFCSVIVILLMVSCTKSPNFPIEPVIDFVSFSQSEIIQKTDSTLLVLSITDGDGDIGHDDNTADIFIKDTRPGQDGFFIRRSMPMVPSLGAENGIKGEIRFPIGSCCTNAIPIGIIACDPVPDEYPEYQKDTVIYEIYVEDVAGHQSNVLTLPPLVLLCD